jgi:hypothetical protein
MHAKTGGFERGDEEMLAYDISDETLEIAAGSGRDRIAVFTLANCTGLSACPA